MIGLWREVEPLQGIIEDVTRWLRNSPLAMILGGGLMALGILRRR